MSNEVAIAQPVREVVVFSQRDNQMITVESDDVTWGSFKKNFGGEISFKNMRGVVKSTKNTLDVDDARLPEESFTVFLFPKKVKSGIDPIYTKEEYLKSYTSKQLRKLCGERGLGTKGTKEDFAERLADYDAGKKPEIKETAKKEAPVSSALVPSKKETGLSKNYGTIESATVSTEMTVRINDASQLSTLLATMFPGMEVVEIDAVVNLKAKLKLGSPVEAAEVVEEATVSSPKKTAPEGPKKSVKDVVASRKKAAPKVKESKDELAAMAAAMKDEMNF